MAICARPLRMTEHQTFGTGIKVFFAMYCRAVCSFRDVYIGGRLENQMLVDGQANPAVPIEPTVVLRPIRVMKRQKRVLLTRFVSHGTHSGEALCVAACPTRLDSIVLDAPGPYPLSLI